MVLTPALFLEYEERLISDPALHALALTDQDLINVLDELAALSMRIRVDIRWRPVSDDPDDDMVIECAVNGQADLIITFDERGKVVKSHERLQERQCQVWAGKGGAPRKRAIAACCVSCRRPLAAPLPPLLCRQGADRPVAVLTHKDRSAEMILVAIYDELAVAGQLVRLHGRYLLCSWLKLDIDRLQYLTIAVEHLNCGLAQFVAHVDEITIELVIPFRDKWWCEERGRMGGSGHQDEAQQERNCKDSLSGHGVLLLFRMLLSWSWSRGRRCPL